MKHNEVPFQQENEEHENECGCECESSPTGGSVTTVGNGICIHSMVIAGQIEGHFAASPQSKSTKYEQCIPTLVAVEENDSIDGLLLLLNTIGGDIEAGLAIAELISGMTKPTVSLVLGGGHSIGVPLAVSAKRSFIVPSATMTLHPVRLNGLVIGVPQTFANLSKMQERIIDFIVRNSNAESEAIRRLMTATDDMTTDIGTVIGGREAVEYGIIDRVGGLGDAVAELKQMIINNKK
ncbi:MAG: ATP-dependent Clp protease proteolytic subunit [Clostridia bacterium]|nr:ATP-dependent Clp protease proteolytic subunit [Clostridia bacterium]